MPDTYTFSNSSVRSTSSISSNEKSPTSYSNSDGVESLGRRNVANIGTSASPECTRSHFDDSPGSAFGGVNNSRKHHPTTPDGVNAQSSVIINSSGQDSNEDSRLVTVDVTQLTHIIRSVIQEEIGALKNNVGDLMDQIHLDIINLQAEIILNLQEQHVSFTFNLLLACHHCNEGLL